MRTSTTAIRAATPMIFWVLMYSSIRNGVVSPGVETTLLTMSSTAANSPDAFSTDHTPYVATTRMMPAAMEKSSAVFITDHGSRRDSRSRALRVRRAVPTLGLAVTSGCAVAAAAGAAGATVPASTAGITTVSEVVAGTGEDGVTRPRSSSGRGAVVGPVGDALVSGGAVPATT